MEQQPLYVFTSHIDGKNAKVALYTDRLEWTRPRSMSGGKLLLGTLTAGASLLATGVKDGRSGGAEMIPVKMMTSVSVARDGMMNSKVLVTVSGNVVDFRVSHAEAKNVKEHLTKLILGTHPTQQQAPQQYTQPPMMHHAPPAARPVQAQSDPMAQLTQLGQLRDAGILSPAEFDAKKSEILARM
ncbi:hypothetical protein MB46_10465 [Arthrobacter alpinus]|uniref:SHOCT domain-containing protein n=1 Tax=Arthrobacter alpinus TaxID=656366 RepID=UPI0005CA1914|nr:SHOCT domain-containing protein [Arthrobacter alpinus]ALV45843.1 hypothetical protein MB46_10465 [Arthrobacter alpinus]